MDKNKTSTLVIMLGAITLVCALLLGFMNAITAPQIALNEIKTRDAAMALIIPGAEFTDMNLTTAGSKTEPAITGVFQATVDGAEAGYCVQVTPTGFAGAVTCMVGINADGTVAGVKVTGHAETPGLGAKAQSDSDWIGQFAGMPADGALAVTKDGGSVTPITGATITSRAVTLGVNTAAAYVATLG